jgi:Na+/H+-dicarboxylate symporter
MPAVLAGWPVAADAAAALRSGAGDAAASVPELATVRDLIASVVPTNPFAAAAAGEMLPLVVFALLFGFAAARIAASRRELLLGFFQAVADTMFVLVHWILLVAPIGVFVLALGVGARGGLSAAGAIGHYLVLLCGLAVFITVLQYPVAVLAARVALGRFARALAPAQVVAFSTQSSLASLPAMLEGTHSQLGIPTKVTSIVLPLAVSLFRVTSPPMNIAIVIFVAHIYGVPLDPASLAVGIAVAVLTNFAVVGLPGQITFFTTTVPISMAMGVPVDLLPLLLAVEVIPDIFRTVGNVTADMTVTAVLAPRSQDTFHAD